MGASQVNPIKPIFTCFELMTFVVLVFLPQPAKRSRAQRAGPTILGIVMIDQFVI